MKQIVVTFLFLTASVLAKAQTVENIFINLYTDSLKKGTHNYINVDGKMSNGSWKPLTANELTFTSDYGTFKGNDLILPDNPTVKKINVTVALKSNPQKTERVTIWIKQKPDPLLPANDQDVLRTRKRLR